MSRRSERGSTTGSIASLGGRKPEPSKQSEAGLEGQQHRGHRDSEERLTQFEEEKARSGQYRL